MQNHRIVVTGMGAITPLGLTVEETWDNLLQGKSGVRPITEFDASDLPTTISATVRGFAPENYMDAKLAKRSARFTQFSLAATQMALQDAALDLAREDPTRIGLEIGSAVGAVDLIESQTLILRDQGARRLNPTTIPSIIINAASCQVAIAYGLKGPANSPAAACSTGIYALGQAMRLLQRGDVDVVIAGGTESCMSPVTVAAFARLGALSRRNDEPERACRPFDAERDGTVVGEGAAILIMETLEHALRRDAPILGEVLGYGVTVDGYHMVAPDPTGDGAARAMRLALEEARLSPADIDYIVPHGTGTPLNDESETKALKQVLGERAYAVPISSNKSMLGHMLGAAGAISVVIGLLAIRDGVIPPTINLETPDPVCDLDYVPLRLRKQRVDTVFANAFGLGGQNATLVVRRYNGTA